MKRDKIFGERDPARHLVYGLIGSTIGLSVVVVIIFFSDIGDDIPFLAKVFLTAVTYVGGVLWIYSNRPNRRPGSWI